MTNDTLVGRLRVHATADTPGVRAGVRADLRQCRLAPPGMPPGAVLVVRRLGMTLNGSFGPHGERHRTWLDDPTTATARLWRAAARPAHGAVPSTATAVYFQDRVDLLRCLLIDMAQGRFQQHWWWSHAASTLDLGRTVLDVCSRAPEELPGVLASMTAVEQTMVVQALTAVEAVAVVRKLAAAHDAPHLTGVFRSDGPVDAQLTGRVADFGRLSVAPMDEMTGAPPTPQRFDAMASPVPAHTVLLEVAAIIATAGSRARSADFAHAIERWIAPTARTPHADLPGAARDASLPDNPTDTAPEPVAAPDDPPDTPSEPVAAPCELNWRDRPARTAELDLMVDTPLDAVPQSAPDVSSTTRSAEASPAEPVVDLSDATATGTIGEFSDAGHAAPVQTSRLYDSAEERVAAEVDDAFIVTNLAGSFLLIGAMERLGLLHIVESTWGLDSEVGGWRVLAALTRACLNNPADHEDDAIWLLFDRLAGGPSAHLRDADDFVVPGQWRESLGEPTSDQSPPDTPAWLQPILPWFQLLLAELGFPASAIETEVLARRGRVWADRTHIDVELPLQDVSLAARRAGLDKNPGWVPTLGHVINFHFE